MANGDPKKKKAKDRLVKSKTTGTRKGGKPTFKATVTTKKVAPKTKIKTKVTIKKRPVVKYSYIVKSKTGTRKLATRIATGARAKQLIAVGKRKKADK